MILFDKITKERFSIILRSIACIFVFFMILTISLKANAGFFDSLGSCFTDPCNCFNDSAEEEQWGPDGQTMKQLSFNTFDYSSAFTNRLPASGLPINRISRPNRNCPPYDRYSGRRNCLYQFDAPSSAFLPTYRVYCAEADPSASYKNPTIKLRMQSCNIFACWTQSTRLDAGSSECITWPTQYGIPTIRFCTRVAVNRMSEALNSSGEQLYNANGTPSISYTPDPGYKYHFLDTNGFPRPDPGIENTAGYKAYLPKICLYEDPSYLESLAGYMEPYRKSGIDMFDLDIYSQPLHYDPTGKNGGNNSLGFMDFMMGAKANQMVEENFYFSNDSDFFTSAMMTYTAGKTWDTSYTEWVKEFAVAKKDSLGCTFLPLGPFPQPFCDELKPLGPSVTVQPICPQAPIINSDSGQFSYGTIDSTYTKPCAKSPISNNFIKNAIRVTIDDVVPICQNSSANPMTTSNCVKIISSGKTPRDIYTNYNDMLPKCSDPTSPTNAPCIVTRLNPTTNSKFRVLYGIKTSASSALRQIGGFPSDITYICSATLISYPCVDIFGINNGPYSDIAFDLSNSSNISYTNNYTKLEDQSLNDVNSRPYTIKPYISYQGSEAEDIEVDTIVTLPPNSMCIYYTPPSLTNIEEAGCVSRAPYPLVSAYSCTSPPAGTSCSSTPTHFAPKILGALSYTALPGSPPTDASYREVSTTLASNSSTPPTAIKTNIIGYILDSLVIDSDQLTIPFPAARRIRGMSNSIWGEYENNIYPLGADASAQPNANARYIGKIEYIAGGYNRGGTQMAVLGTNSAKCHTAIPGKKTATGMQVYDNRNCVLSKLIYQDRVNCTNFKNANAATRCSSQEVTRCTTIAATLPITSSTETVKIRQCSDYNCYESSLLTDNICAIDQSPAGRVIPAYTSPNVAIPSSFYNYTLVTAAPCAPRASSTPGGAILPYDPDKCGTRDKTIIEQGITGAIPAHPPCAAITSASAASGYATWPQTNIGSRATGACSLGYKASGTLGTRLCYGDNAKNSVFEPIASSSTCIVATCPSIPYSEAAGHASWTATNYAATSTPTCGSGLTLPDGGFSPRTCGLQSDNTYRLNDINSGQWCYYKASSVAGEKRNITLTASNHWAHIHGTGTGSRVNVQTSHDCCTWRVAGVCWEEGTCYDDHWGTEYTVSIGHPSYFRAGYSWLTPNPASNTAYNFEISFSGGTYTVSNIVTTQEGSCTSSQSANKLTISCRSGSGATTGAKATFKIRIPD